MVVSTDRMSEIGRGFITAARRAKQAGFCRSIKGNQPRCLPLLPLQQMLRDLRHQIQALRLRPRPPQTRTNLREITHP